MTAYLYLEITIENTLKSFYGRSGHANPEKEINDLRTKLANKISNDAARMKPNVFCKAYGSRITQALQMPQDKLRRWAATPFAGIPFLARYAQVDKFILGNKKVDISLIFWLR